jgi:hypothetical protein
VSELLERRHSLLEPIAVHSAIRSPTELPVGLSLPRATLPKRASRVILDDALRQGKAINRVIHGSRAWTGCA